MMFFKCNSWQTDTVIKHRAKSPVLFAFETTKTVWIIPDEQVKVHFLVCYYNLRRWQNGCLLKGSS